MIASIGIRDPDKRDDMHHKCLNLDGDDDFVDFEYSSVFTAAYISTLTDVM